MTQDVKGKTFIFETLPQTLDELKAYSLKTPFETAALAIAVLYHFENDMEHAFTLLNYLKGPSPMSIFERDFIKERLKQKGYKIKAFFEGSSPENNYQPTTPYTIHIYETPYSKVDAHWMTLYVKSSGADSLRGIKLRQKPSSGQWFLNELQCLSDIRLPLEEDTWA